MIDLGLTKIALIGVVALVVIGPEKLPRVARMAGTLFGRAQRYINQVKSEVSREMELDEFRRMHQEVAEAAAGAGKSAKEAMNEVRNDLDDAWHDRASTHRTIHGGSSPVLSADSFAIKSRAFRKKCLARNCGTAKFFTRHGSRRTRVVSAAARVARYRPGTAKPLSSFFS